jgi:hypothetical protein
MVLLDGARNNNTPVDTCKKAECIYENDGVGVLLNNNNNN